MTPDNNDWDYVLERYNQAQDYIRLLAKQSNVCLV